MLLIGGEIAASSLAWPGIFYISGGVGVLWCILWAIFGSNSPEECKRISEEEKHYIQSSLGQITDVDDLKVQAEYLFASLFNSSFLVERGHSLEKHSHFGTLLGACVCSVRNELWVLHPFDTDPVLLGLLHGV